MCGVGGTVCEGVGRGWIEGLCVCEGVDRGTVCV